VRNSIIWNCVKKENDLKGNEAIFSLFVATTNQVILICEIKIIGFNCFQRQGVCKGDALALEDSLHNYFESY
jgi:hypothetical protein